MSGITQLVGLGSASTPYKNFNVTLIGVEKIQFNDALVVLPSSPSTSTSTDGKITGTNNPETLTGTSAKETIDALAGNDVINGAGGDDVIDGGAGDDVALFFDQRSNFSVTTLNGVAQVVGLATASSDYRNSKVTLTNVESIRFSDTFFNYCTRHPATEIVV